MWEGPETDAWILLCQDMGASHALVWTPGSGQPMFTALLFTGQQLLSFTPLQAQALREALERELRRQSSADVPSRTRRNVLRATGDGPRATNDSCDGSEGGGTGVGASRRTSRGSCDECGCYSTSMAPLSMAQAQGRDLDRMSTTPGDGDGGGRAPAAGTAAAVSRGWGAGTDSLGSGVTVSESGVSTCEGGAGAEAGALVGVRWLRAQVHAAGMREDQGRRGEAADVDERNVGCR